MHILHEMIKSSCPDVKSRVLTRRENAPSSKTQEYKKSMNIDIWVVGTLTQLFIRGSYTAIRFSKKNKIVVAKLRSLQ